MIGAIPFESGPGLKVYALPTDAPWYGSGYCAICGGEPFPARIRFWDPDDGWKSGVLCPGCAAVAAERGPHPDDYALRVMDPDRAAHMDAIGEANDGDDDAAHTESEELP